MEDLDNKLQSILYGEEKALLSPLIINNLRRLKMKLSAVLLSTVAVLALASSAMAADTSAPATPEAPKIDPKKEFELKMTIGDLQVIAAGLGALPFAQAQVVSPVLEKLKKELEPQLPKPPAAAAEPAKK